MVKQPYYMIDFSAVSCMFEIRINDIPVICMNVPGQVGTRIPINYAITKSGNQEINIKLLPLIGNISIDERAELKYSIQCFDAATNLKFIDQLEAYEFPKIEEAKKIPIVTKASTLVLEVPYILNQKWQQGETLRGVKELQKKLKGVYLELGNLIQNEHFDIFKEKLRNRENNMATSMYLSDVESNSRVKSLIRDFQNGFNNMRIASDAVVIYSAFGKKAALKKPNGEPALSFVNKESKEELMLDIDFYLPKDTSEFQII